jgi:hypothetical protein
MRVDREIAAKNRIAKPLILRFPSSLAGAPETQMVTRCKEEGGGIGPGVNAIVNCDALECVHCLGVSEVAANGRSSSPARVA